jgi:putative acetyltransferase
MSRATGVTIWRETADDVKAIRDVHRAAFGRDVEAKITDGLRQAGDLKLSLVAVVDEGVVGNICFSPMTIAPTTDKTLWALGPIGVLPDHQGQGIGSLLVQRGLELCWQSGVDAVLLFGNPAFYGRFGFVPAHPHGLTNEFGGEDAFQIVVPVPQFLTELSGHTCFAPAFRAA